MMLVVMGMSLILLSDEDGAACTKYDLDRTLLSDKAVVCGG